MSGIASRQNEILSKLGFNSYGAREFLPGNLDNEIVVPDINQYFSDQSIPLSKVDFVIYDAVVDQTGRGTHLTIQDALNSGKKRIFVRAGTYTLTADIVIPSDCLIIGENKEDTIINCDSYSINIKASGTDYTTGTLTLTNGDATVTGIGTSWVGNIVAGESIYISGIGVFKIESVTDNTHLELEFVYYGITITTSYSILELIKNITLENITIKGSAAGIIDLKDCINIKLQSLIIEGTDTSTAFGIQCNTRLLQSKIDDIKIFNVSRGISGDILQNNEISNIEIFGASGVGIILITGNYDNNWNNINVHNCDTGISLLSVFRNNFNNIISEWNNTVGVALTNSQYCNLNNFQIHYNGRNGLSLYQAKWNNIINNNIGYNSQSSSGTYSDLIMLNSGNGCFNNNIMGNNINSQAGKSKYSIREDNALDDSNIISNNNTGGAITDNISTQGANTIVGDNIS